MLRFALVVMVGMASVSAAVPAPGRKADATARASCSAYCSCGYCCGWYRDAKGVARVRKSGRIKHIGVTASGTVAKHGTAAVDPKVYPRGTIFFIPGYGYAKAEDRGGSVKGGAIELWFDTHQTALNWGRKQKEIKIWYPNSKKGKSVK